MEFGVDHVTTTDGHDATGQDTLDIVNPATGKTFARAPRATEADLDAAVTAARRTLPGWRATPIEDRRRALIALGNAIAARAEPFGRLFTGEQGRPLAPAIAEIRHGAYWLKVAAKLDPPIDVTEDPDQRRVEVRHDRIGAAAAIVPLNYPFLLAIWEIAPALLAGNTIVVKPSPFTPLYTAVAVARRLETETVWINQNLQNTPFYAVRRRRAVGSGHRKRAVRTARIHPAENALNPPGQPGGRVMRVRAPAGDGAANARWCFDVPNRRTRWISA